MKIASNFTRILTNENVSPNSSCSCRTLVLRTTMLKSFPRPSFLDRTRGSIKPLNRKAQFSSKKFFDFFKNCQLYHFMILCFHDAIFNQNVKPKVTERGWNLKITTNFFARLGRVFWVCSRYILFQWMHISISNMTRRMSRLSMSVSGLKKYQTVTKPPL